MTLAFPGNAVVELIKNATSRIIIVAPYIKSVTIHHLLKKIPETVSELICVTRWLPGDIVSGVCDLEIFDDIMQLKSGQLRVHPHLHAKYYSNGQTTLVGSANLTSSGLGWNMPTNVELLVELSADFPGLLDWESRLLNSSVEVTPLLHKQIYEQAEQLRKDQLVDHISRVEIELEERINENIFSWLPQCPVPNRLWEVYCGRGADIMVSSAFKAAQDDLASLSPPQGLSKDLFTMYMAGILQQTLLFKEINRLAMVGLTDEKAHKFLSDHFSGSVGDVNDVCQIWRIIKSWMLFFFPESFMVETDQEVLIKGQRITGR